ncbi:hypothetical protein [Kutzneria kofuensis]|uniref:Uncharacterized protein n=1 Tax=Kutzneria kofuensis TaxID=103725 RepID=A0A7W9NHE7_9PSEU|nr:hypothetical protein [Kutzneria kofuensis]MBB5892058.1 hypothetical protein [Kutzneria kofuensis]
MGVAVSDRRTVYTHSTAGLLFGLFGGVVSAFFAYFVTITPGGAFLLDVGATFGDLTRLADIPPLRWPVVVLDPALPVLELMVVPLCSLSAARHVGPSLISRPRLLWIGLFGLVLALGVLTTGTVPEQAHWLGLVIVLVALSLPHHPDPR